MDSENIFSDIDSSNIVDHWTNQANTGEPLIGEVLFPQKVQTDSQVEWYRGQNTAVAPLALSSFDTESHIRDRSGLQKISTNTQYSKDSFYIDEKTRQQLLRVQASGTDAQKDALLNHVFQDTDNLIKGAQTTAELMRLNMLKTGKINLRSNGVQMDVDYQMKQSHINNSDTLWTDDKSNPYNDIQVAMDTINADSGLTPTRILMNTVTYRALQSNDKVKQTILNPAINSGAVSVSNSMINSYLSDLGLAVQTYDKQYLGYDGQMHKYIEDGQVIIMPDGDLGSTYFSTTPEQADFLSAQDVDVSVTDGVAITTYLTRDPVNKKIRASQQLIPSFEMIDGVYVINNVASFQANRDKASNPIDDSSSNTGKGSNSSSSSSSSSSGSSAKKS